MAHVIAQVVTDTCLEVLDQGPLCYYSTTLLQALLFICKIMAKKNKKHNISNCINCGYLLILCYADADDDQHENKSTEYHRYDSQEPNRDFYKKKERKRYCQ